MTKVVLLVVLALMLPCSFGANEASLSRFAGEWIVDLRPTPDAEPYLQAFRVRLENEGSFSGEFYNTPFTGGRYNDVFGELYFAFITADASTEYYHSSKLVDGRLEGLTHAPNRDLLQFWTATRSP